MPTDQRQAANNQDGANQAATDKQHLISPPAISLPKGGGAIRGIDEKFQVNPATGTGSMSIPIFTSPGRQGFGPQLTLSYDSGAGNGPFGLGWNLSLLNISRKTDKGLPRYQDAEDSDVFILSGAEDLVPVLVEDGDGWRPEALPDRTVDGSTYHIQRYRPRIEGLFARIERWTDAASGEIHWRSISKDNVTTLYGKTAESRIADPADPERRIFRWLICESYDDKGNALVYEYAAENSDNVDLLQLHERNRTFSDRSVNRYLKRIKYGNRTPRQPGEDLSQRDDWLFEVLFDYGEGHYVEQPPDALGRRFVEVRNEPAGDSTWPARQDPFSSYRAGFEVRTYRLCRRVLMFHRFPEELGVDHYLVRSTAFTHDEGPIASYLTAATQSGYVHESDNLFLRKSLPPVEFEYSEVPLQDGLQAGDAQSLRVREIDPESLENLPIGLDGTSYRFVDLDGEGLSGILTEQAEAWFYKPNLGDGRFGPLEAVAQKPSLAALNGGRQQLLDLAGDGQLDLALLGAPTPGFYERTPEESWAPFRTFTLLPNTAWDDPNLRFVDLTGDGHADVLITEDQVLAWHPSLAEAGFGPRQQARQALDEEQGPRLVFADGTQSIYLADISGDGLTDLARVRNGEVCYWPNLGYGRFGAKVSMDSAPWFDTPDLFDQRRVRLADVDGSGITDIVYLGRDGVRLYYNRSGNGWSDGETLPQFPHVDNLAAVQVVDLLGNGTACLVWSSSLPGDAQRPLRYVDLMDGRKPHLLVGVKNNLGAETRVHYAPSTQFYLADQAAGRPWITRLPFPVHVVERVETYDHISRNRFVSRYAYHHGFFDGWEREFRGFGLVEQFDTEAFAALEADGVLDEADNLDQASHVPPVHTKTWFHTGVYVGRDLISSFFAGLLDGDDLGEYYREPGLDDQQARALLLADTVLPSGLSAEEEREACRALKGATLRQEVYALDGTPQAPHPYIVKEQNLTIRQLQPHGPNRHAVFFTHAREAISYHYERDPLDPRVGHSCVLATDDFGNVRQSVAVSYGRRQADPTLSPEDQDRQSQILITCTENDFTNAVEEDDAYRTPLPAEVRTYEITGLELPADQVRFTFAELQEAVDTGTEIAYHTVPTPGILQKRLLEQARTLYRPDDLGEAQNDPLALLPLGVLASLALPGESYTLAFTPEHLELVFGDRVTETMLSDDGRYVHLDGDDNWWIPSGRVFLSPDQDDGPVQELAFAQQHFFVPLRFRDPFGQTSFVTYDDHDLLPLETRDPLGNRVTAGERNIDGSVAPRINYRVLQPELMTGPNGNRSAVAFDLLGMVAGTAVMGKATENLGDALEGFQAQLTRAQIDDFFADPRGPDTTELLGDATSRIIYDETRFQRLEQPAFAATIVRETHVSDLGDGEATALQVNLAYSDGFGRAVQKKAQAEPGPVPLRDQEGLIILGPDGQPQMTDDDFSPRWVGSGWTVFNNKGKPVRQYEPFFTDTHDFEFDVRIGVSPVLFYDPLERVVATLHPNHTWEKVVFDPWRQESWDVNDTVLAADPAGDPHVGHFFERLDQAEYLPTWHQARIGGGLGNAEQDAAQKAAAHAGTPTIVHADALGRPFLTIADNGPDGQYQTRTEQDIEGNPLRIIDPRGNVVMVYRIESDGDPPVRGHDVAGRQLYERGMDAGERRLLADIGGQPIRSWDSRGHAFRSEYDELRRPTRSFVAGAVVGDPDREILFQHTVYGEGQGDADNHRGRVFQIFDGAGVVTSHVYDFKGNPRHASRQLLVNYRDAVDWNLNPSLEAGTFSTHTTYDALNRPVTITTPDDSVTLLVYNEANFLEQIAVRLRGADLAMPFVEDIDYNARGQREAITYATSDGANFTTTYDYDPFTFRLTHLLTLRGATFPDDCPDPPGPPCGLQNLRYTYDPVGNITLIRDDAQQAAFFNNVQVEPHNDYTYDAIYRLVRAEGREHAAQNNFQRDATQFNAIVGIPFPNSPEALQRYTEEYEYDEVGNFLRFVHRGGDVLRWTRCYQYALDSNRLLGTSGAGEFQTQPCPQHYVPGPESTLSERYHYDEHGNMTRMPHLHPMRWDFKDQLQASSQQEVNNGGTPETTYYVYDAAGQRVRKVTERFQPDPNQEPTRRDERLYLGGFEIYREYNGNGSAITLERETLHVMDDAQRVALVETKTVDTQSPISSPQSLTRYQLGNHLGSASLELDDEAAVISYEEYHPYGTSAYRAGSSVAETTLKRYRYTGKERDGETELYYHGARYYAPWLGRWTAADPIGVGDGVNQYLYVRGNPVIIVDPSGTQGNTVLGWLREREAALVTAYKRAGSKAQRQEIWSELQGVLEEISDEKEFIAKANDTSMPYTDDDPDPTQRGVNPRPDPVEPSGPVGSYIEGAAESLFEVGATLYRSARDWTPIENAKETFRDPIGTAAKQNVISVAIDTVEAVPAVIEDYQEVDRLANEVESSLKSGDDESLRANSKKLGAKHSILALEAFMAGFGLRRGKKGARKGKTRRVPKGLPPPEEININLDHIKARHTASGSGRGPGRDYFPDMTDEELDKAIRSAYANAREVVMTNNESGVLVMRGSWGNVDIEFWYHTRTQTINTAYPK